MWWSLSRHVSSFLPLCLLSSVWFPCLSFTALFGSSRPAFDKQDGLTPEEEEARAESKRKMLGNIRFVGRLQTFLPYFPTSLHFSIVLLWTLFCSPFQLSDCLCFCFLLLSSHWLLGELARLDMLHQSILHRCVKQVRMRWLGGGGGVFRNYFLWIHFLTFHSL